MCGACETWTTKKCKHSKTGRPSLSCAHVMSEAAREPGCQEWWDSSIYCGHQPEYLTECLTYLRYILSKWNELYSLYNGKIFLDGFM